MGWECGPPDLGQGKLARAWGGGGVMEQGSLALPSSLVSWRLSSAPSLSPSLSPFFLGLYSSDLLTPHFSDTLHPLPSTAYLTPHICLCPLSLHPIFPLHPPARIGLPPHWPALSLSPLALPSLLRAMSLLLIPPPRTLRASRPQAPLTPSYHPFLKVLEYPSGLF